MKRNADEALKPRQNKKLRKLILHEAAALGDVEAVRELLEDPNVDVNKEKSGYTALDNAVSKRYNIINFHKNRQPLFFFKLFQNIWSKDYSFETAIERIKDYERSEKDNYLEVAKLLLERGARINALSDDGICLTLACRGNDLSMVELLLKYGANCNIRANRYSNGSIKDLNEEFNVTITENMGLIENNELIEVMLYTKLRSR
ncbi:MAG: hypothetical protein K0R73_906 [Candidatus Midichloriaceae bacterium]|jgi:ankyrin repeat protein|nr:hypothetical protein [Candidatus Midichloriaceae bacterium]